MRTPCTLFGREIELISPSTIASLFECDNGFFVVVWNSYDRGRFSRNDSFSFFYDKIKISVSRYQQV
jgi:hypothetical protein